MKLLTLAFFALLPLQAFAGVLDGKTPATFADRYGIPKSAKNVSSISALHVKRGNVSVTGQFSIREYRDGDLTVTVTYFIPSLQAASVRLQLKRQWTREQVEAALAAYGGSWQTVTRNGIVDSWIAPDGSLAINLLTWVEIQSKTIVEAVARNFAAEDAKRKAVPKFLSWLPHR